ncbi:hypothetical protein C8R45DRAFT_945388 [Mycena sanguinolenta]|nr:hypothetical protein C8R45DRAFT_945388 [Mycena sanguinolenta]
MALVLVLAFKLHPSSCSALKGAPIKPQSRSAVLCASTVGFLGFLRIQPQCPPKLRPPMPLQVGLHVHRGGVFEDDVVFDDGAKRCERDVASDVWCCFEFGAEFLVSSTSAPLSTSGITVVPPLSPPLSILSSTFDSGSSGSASVTAKPSSLRYQLRPCVSHHLSTPSKFWFSSTGRQARAQALEIPLTIMRNDDNLTPPAAADASAPARARCRTQPAPTRCACVGSILRSFPLPLKFFPLLLPASRFPLLRFFTIMKFFACWKQGKRERREIGRLTRNERTALVSVSSPNGTGIQRKEQIKKRAPLSPASSSTGEALALERLDKAGEARRVRAAARMQTVPTIFPAALHDAFNDHMLVILHLSALARRASGSARQYILPWQAVSHRCVDLEAHDCDHCSLFAVQLIQISRLANLVQKYSSRRMRQFVLHLYERDETLSAISRNGTCLEAWWFSSYQRTLQ